MLAANALLTSFSARTTTKNSFFDLSMLKLILPTVLVFIAFVSVNALNNGVAQTPPMGWMSWTKFECQIDCKKFPNACINEDLYVSMAERMAMDGYKDVGYEFIHLDDCWMSMKRDDDGMLTANETRFPHGMQWLANRIHSLGLKFAIYEDFGTTTCMSYPGSMGHLKEDADTFASWDVDYLKLDGCSSNIADMPKGYPEMERDLNATGRPIVYSCSWPAYLMDEQNKVNYTEIAEHCNLWRNCGDIDLKWGTVMGIIDWYNQYQDKMAEVHGPGQWNDPDMIIAGNNELTDDQAKAQMTIWSIWSAPLIMSNDLRDITPTQKAILQNREVIAIDQDPFGIFGKLITTLNDDSVYVYAKPVTPVDSSTGEQPSWAIAFLNTADSPTSVSINAASLGLTNPAGYKLRDLWAHKDIGSLKRQDAKIKAKIPATGVAFFKATIIN